MQTLVSFSLLLLLGARSADMGLGCHSMDGEDTLCDLCYETFLERCQAKCVVETYTPESDWEDAPESDIEPARSESEPESEANPPPPMVLPSNPT